MSKRNGNGASTLRLDPHNARKHPDRNKAQIAASLKELGAGRSILVDATDTIIAGNGVYEQAQALGYKVKVIEADGKTLIAVKRPDLKGAKARRMALADNRATETSKWDVDVLADLAANDADALAGLFDERELRDLLGDKMPGGKEETADSGEVLVDKAEELQAKWQVCSGDVWQVGKHRVMCGDSTNAADVARLMGGEKATLFTDPPYGISVNTEWLSALHIQRGKPRNLSDDTLQGDDGTLDLSFLWEYERRFVWGFPYIFDAHATGWVVWDKQPGVDERGIVTPIEMASTTLRKGFDMVRVMWGGYYRAKGETREPHPTQKPVRVFAPFIEQFTRQDEIIYDPFLGSGTTLVACVQTGRIGRGMEIEPKYVAVTLERLTALGLQPKRVTDTNGKTKETA